MRTNKVELAIAYWAPWDQEEVKLFLSQGWVGSGLPVRISDRNEYFVFLKRGA